ncbi:MAG: nucleoside monophosphate kinase [Patescibacteria group bacterium]|nr:nucleoside monophosphate kinase [Patescibacteria group bacterium]
MKKLSKIAIIIYGVPGSGKGTQAKLLADKFGLFQFDTGDYLRKIFKDLRFKKNKEIQKEKKLNEFGKLNSPEWVLKIVSQKTKELSENGESVVFSGSPRTLFETFGNNKKAGLMKILEKEYGKNNIYIFVLDILEEESIKRNSNRSVCSICKTPLMGQQFRRKVGIKNQQPKICPFCGGKIEHRIDDKKNIITARLKEYQIRTQPIFTELKKKKYKIFHIDGMPSPYKIHEKIISYFK